MTVSSPSSSALLDLREVSRRFGGLQAISNVSMAVNANEVYGVIGPNGAGKTSLFNCVTSFAPPTSGTILIDGDRIDGLAPHDIAARGIARTYQNVRLFQSMTAIDNVMVGRHMHMRTGFWSIALKTKAFQEGEREANERSGALLDFVGLSHRRSVLARNLSYGEQRRLEIARALATEPRVLLLDEPAAGMNPSEAVELIGLIDKIRGELGVTILLIEHHMRVVMTICDRITVLDRGKVIASGTPAEVQSDSIVIDAYLGRRHQGDGKAGPGARGLTQ